MAPDTPIPPVDTEDAEEVALTAAVEEARAEMDAGKPSVPHAQVREELVQFAARMREKIAALRKP
jgi:hypothetical protein